MFEFKICFKLENSKNILLTIIYNMHTHVFLCDINVGTV